MVLVKNAIISAVILLVIITLLIINSIILENCTASLLEITHNMSDDPLAERQKAIELEEKWNRIEPFVSISVVHLETEAVSSAAALMRTYSETNNISEFIAAKKLFKLAVEHIVFSGALSLETVL